MGAGASAAKYETDAVSQKSVEAVRILQLLSGLGKSEAQDKVIESVSKKFAEADTENKGLDVATVKPIVEAALKEHAAADAAELETAIMTSVERNHITDGLVQLAGLSSAIAKKMSRSHTVHRAKEKFNELDVDKSGFIDGKEIPKVIDWVLQIGDADNDSRSPEEIHEARTILLMRIDVNRDEKLSFEEFLVLFEEEQRRGLVKNYATMKFKELDKDGSGFLEKVEINSVVDWLLDLNQEDIQDTGASKDAIKQDLLDLSGEITGSETRISLDNFIKVCDIVVEQVEMRRRAIQKFLALDSDKSGYLENTELHKVVDFMYYNLGIGQALDHDAAKKDMMSLVDGNADGKLDFAEFIKLFEEVYVNSRKALAGITLAPEMEAQA